ncbi:succinylglutamate desuccinylase/aspartoacylase family protein [Actinomadura chokoriensis]|uniref:M14 family metallopeptidase n=1 Tax=Actinomadura chokoriensis TaxID=454156 RepID=A0ABV4R1A0_9ACTN
MSERLAAGPDLDLDIVRFGDGDGPAVSILGGVHGDELEGVLAAYRIADRLASTHVRGTVTVLPRANPPALAAGTRHGDGDANLARLFPGDPGGGLSDGIAHAIATALIEPCDLLIDLHSAGHRYRMPPMCGFGAGGTLGGRPMLDAARTTPFPYLWAHASVAPGRSVSHAEALGKPWAYFESGGGGALREADIGRYEQGVLRLLEIVGTLDPVSFAGPPPGRQVVVTGGDGNTDTGVLFTTAGVFVSSVKAGDAVATGQAIGAVYDDGGRKIETVRASSSGRVMMLRHHLRVAPGEVAAIVAGEDGRAA